MVRAAACLAIVLVGGAAGAIEPGFINPIFVASSPTPTITARPTPTATTPPCPGDLNHDGSVRVDELIRIINVALEGCPQ